jgi:hypothetical protein
MAAVIWLDKESWAQFHQRSMYSFCDRRSKNRKKDPNDLTTHKRTNFSYECRFGSFF